MIEKPILPDENEIKIRVRENEDILAFKRMFSSTDGQRVLDNISRVFGLDEPAFIRRADGTYCDTEGKIRDGQRQVFLHIKRMLLLEFRQDTKESRVTVKK